MKSAPGSVGKICLAKAFYIGHGQRHLNARPCPSVNSQRSPDQEKGVCSHVLMLCQESEPLRPLRCDVINRERVLLLLLLLLLLYIYIFMFTFVLNGFYLMFFVS